MGILYGSASLKTSMETSRIKEFGLSITQWFQFLESNPISQYHFFKNIHTYYFQCSAIYSGWMRAELMNNCDVINIMEYYSTLMKMSSCLCYNIDRNGEDLSEVKHVRRWKLSPKWDIQTKQKSEPKNLWNLNTKHCDEKKWQLGIEWRNVEMI